MLGEKTTKLAKNQIKKAAKLLVSAKHPVISVNGNVAVLVASDIVKLSKIIPAKLEVNVFHKSKKREKAIALHLKKNGAKEDNFFCHEIDF